MTEKFKHIVGYEMLYIVGDLGTIINVDGKEMKVSSDGCGYMKITLRKDKKRRTFKVHRLVITAFKGESTMQVDHVNGIKTDNRLENLEYVTPMENSHRRVIKKYGFIKRIDKRGKYRLSA